MTDELESYKKRCLELEKKSENDEKRCSLLEVEIEDLKNKSKVLEGKIMKIREVVESSDGEKFLEGEKEKAESEIFKLKEKVIELASPVYKLESSMNEKTKEDVNVVSRFSSKVRKRLPFEDDGCSSKKIAPSTPGVAQTPFSRVIDISYEDANYDETAANKNISDSTNHAALNKTNLEDFEEPEKVLNDCKETIDNSGRKKVSSFKWKSQGAMEADFRKDPELCMRAVCVLYRQQTEDEKASKKTIYPNGRGFDKQDAYRGSNLAEFLMDGDSKGDLKKTVEELKLYDSKGIELCRSLALYYSWQLFKIYRNKEDPYFLP